MPRRTREAFWLVVFVTLVAHTAGAAARARLGVTEPAMGALDFGKVNIGTTKGPLRITIMNSGDTTPGFPEAILNDPEFEIVNTGGDLAPGHSAFWDIVVTPTEQSRQRVGTTFLFRYLDSDSEDRQIDVAILCQTRRAPFDALDLEFLPSGPGTITTRKLSVLNTSATPLQITGFTFTEPAFSAVLHDGHLPITIAPESRFDLDVRFAPQTPQIRGFVYFGLVAAILDDGSSQFLIETIGSSTGFVDLERAGFQPVPVGQTWRSPTAIANYTSHPVTITGIAITNPVFAIEGLTVGSVIPAFTSLPVMVSATPTQNGDVSADYTINFDTVDALTGDWRTTGYAAQLQYITHDDALDDGILDFGELTSTSPPVTRTLTVHNPTEFGLFIDCMRFGLTGDGFSAPNPFSTVLMPGASLDIDIAFTPVPPEPIRAGERRISGYRVTELGTVHDVIQLTARVPRYEFVLSSNEMVFADTVAFPSEPTTADLSLANTSLTKIPLPIATVTGPGFRLVSAPPPGTLGPFETVSYRGAFAPEADGAVDGTLQLGILRDVALRGTGVARQVAAPATLDFGTVAVGDTVRRSIAIHNASGFAVVASALVTSDPQFQVESPADSMVPPGGDLTVELAFTPTAAAAITAELAISFDAAPEPQLTVMLTGTGITSGMPDPPAGGGCCSSQRGDHGSACALAAVALGMLLRRRRRRGCYGTQR
jgi:hypothetical protein